MNRTRSTRPGRHVLSVIGIALCCLALAACSKPASRELQPGSYRATLQLPGAKSVPFGLDVAREESGTVLYLVNGPERVRVTEVVVADGKLTARMPGYENTLSARVSGDELEGDFSLVYGDDRALKLPFAARLNETWRFYPELPDDNADLTGRWDVSYTDGSGRLTAGVATFEQRFAQVTGTVLMPTVDQRYLAGEVHDEAVRLSRFDGGAALLYEAKLNAKGELVGDFWSDRTGHQRIIARRNPDASIDAATVATHMRDPAAGLEFSFKDPQGRIVSSRDTQFAGKVVLVTLAGSWCPSSHDEAALLTALHRRYRARGLEIVALMFEQHQDFARSAAAVQRFRATYRIEYPTLVAGTMDKASVAQALPQLDGVRAYPTLVFIDRTGRVRRIHTGFAGPATGLAHEVLVHEIATMIEVLLAERDTAGPPDLVGAALPAPTVPSTAPVSPGN